MESARIGRDAFFEAFEAVAGVPPSEMVPFAGRTDLEIALDMLRAQRSRRQTTTRIFGGSIGASYDA